MAQSVENTSMKSLLAEIDSQVFVLDVMKADLSTAALCLEDFDVRASDDQSIEVTVSPEAVSTQCFLN